MPLRYYYFRPRIIPLITLITLSFAFSRHCHAACCRRQLFATLRRFDISTLIAAIRCWLRVFLRRCYATIFADIASAARLLMRRVIRYATSCRRHVMLMSLRLMMPPPLMLTRRRRHDDPPPPPLQIPLHLHSLTSRSPRT